MPIVPRLFMTVPRRETVGVKYMGRILMSRAELTARLGAPHGLTKPRPSNRHDAAPLAAWTFKTRADKSPGSFIIFDAEALVPISKPKEWIVAFKGDPEKFYTLFDEKNGGIPKKRFRDPWGDPIR